MRRLNWVQFYTKWRWTNLWEECEADLIRPPPPPSAHHLLINGVDIQLVGWVESSLDWLVSLCVSTGWLVASLGPKSSFGVLLTLLTCWPVCGLKLSINIVLTIHFLPIPHTAGWYEGRPRNIESRQKVLQYSVLLSHVLWQLWFLPRPQHLS
jgi:hypothetical protein